MMGRQPIASTSASAPGPSRAVRGTGPRPRLAALAPALAVVALLGGCVPSVYDQPYPVRPVEMPADAAAHASPIEWWYYTGHLTAEDGHQYGFEVALFEVYAPPGAKVLGFLPFRWLKDRVHVAHVAVTDVTGQAFAQAQRSDLLSWKGGADRNVLDAWVGDWSIERAEDGVGTRLRASAPGYRFDLTLTPQKPDALHGRPPGIQSMGPGGTSYYVSSTRMAVHGTLGSACGFLGCRDENVTGLAWHDHQWGDFDMESFAGWDWYSLQLDDDTELMLYLIRAQDGTFASAAGSFVTADGSTVPLAAEDFTVEPTGRAWTSPSTGAVYPLGWRVRVPSRAIDVTLTPELDAQEMNTRATTGIVYWEGSVRVDGTTPGVGYVELTNYDRFPWKVPAAAR